MTTKLVVAVVSLWTLAGALWTAILTSSASGFAETVAEFIRALVQ